ncbi:hypothetical protein Tco_1119584 [Tanacetum coccineum]
MPPKMRTQSAGRLATESLGRGTGVRTGRGGGRGRRPRESNDERVDDLNGQGNDQGIEANRCVEGVNGNVERVNGIGDVVLTRWIEKMENVQDMSGYSVNQKVKYSAGSFVGKALTWWNSQIRTLSREVAISLSWNDFNPTPPPSSSSHVTTKATVTPSPPSPPQPPLSRTTYKGAFGFDKHTTRVRLAK